MPDVLVAGEDLRHVRETSVSSATATLHSSRSSSFTTVRWTHPVDVVCETAPLVLVHRVLGVASCRSLDGDLSSLGSEDGCRGFPKRGDELLDVRRERDERREGREEEREGQLELNASLASALEG